MFLFGEMLEDVHVICADTVSSRASEKAADIQGDGVDVRGGGECVV